MRILLGLLLSFTTILTVATVIDLDNPFQYSQQSTPSYITKDNTFNNSITDEGATLGRVLFYDKALSANFSTACASCHQQAFAFSDTALTSTGLVGGQTGRHSMRLVNTRFADERKFFWDERAINLEAQTTMPIQDHIEMGFSGTGGDPTIDSLISRLEATDYYLTLFTYAFGDQQITETRIQRALAQFIRSIQSFDSKYDTGRALVNADNVPFPNFTAAENRGKQLFLAAPPAGGAGCAGCHRPPEFDIDPNTRNNGVIGVANNSSAIDLTNTRSPSLRDLVNPEGTPNGPFMHDGSLLTLAAVIEHYNRIPANPQNTNLDPRLNGPPGQSGQNLQLTPQEKSDLEAFLLTLTGSNLYMAEQWSDPFNSQGQLDILQLTTGLAYNTTSVQLYPNPAVDYLQLSGMLSTMEMQVFNMQGILMHQSTVAQPNHTLAVSHWPSGMYFIQLSQGEVLRFIKQ